MKVPARFLFACALVLPTTTVVAGDFETALERAREADARHRYLDVIEILTPYTSTDNPEVRYVTAAEVGRAYFHLGRYNEAHSEFQEAVRLHPERAETALYLEATSYLLGDREQAFTIFRAVLSSGARDLYLALTLPGERRFAAEPEVQSIIEEYVVPLEVDLEQGIVRGVALGDRRDRVVERLDARSSDPTAPALTATAGPALVWAFVFDGEQRIRESILQTEHLLRYTPYRLQMNANLDWRTTPAAAIAALGTPDESAASPEQGIALTWIRPSHSITLDFGRPRPPQPPGIADGVAMLRTVQLRRRVAQSTGRMIE